MKTNEMGKRNIFLMAGLVFLGLSLIVGPSMALAKSAKEIDVSVDGSTCVSQRAKGRHRCWR